MTPVIESVTQLSETSFYLKWRVLNEHGKDSDADIIRFRVFFSNEYVEHHDWPSKQYL